jgi:hypothetical protein
MDHQVAQQGLRHSAAEKRRERATDRQRESNNEHPPEHVPFPHLHHPAPLLEKCHLTLNK